MKIKYPNKDSFEKIVIYHKNIKSYDELYFLKGKYLSREDFGSLAYKFTHVGFSSIKGIYQVHYHTTRSKSICHERYILNDTIGCLKEIKELIHV